MVPRKGRCSVVPTGRSLVLLWVYQRAGAWARRSARAWARRSDPRKARRTAPLLVLTTVGASAAGSARPRARTLEGGWARTWGRPSGYMKARGTARASERPWVRNSVRACVVAVVRCFVLPFRVVALSRRQRGFWGVPRRPRDAVDAKAPWTSTLERVSPWADGVHEKGGRRVRTSAEMSGPRSARRRAPARGAPWAPATASASATSRARTWGRSCAGVYVALASTAELSSRRRRRDAIDAIDAGRLPKNKGRRHWTSARTSGRPSDCMKVHGTASAWARRWASSWARACVEVFCASVPPRGSRASAAELLGRPATAPSTLGRPEHQLSSTWGAHGRTRA